MAEPTQADVARAAGVSTALVSIVMRDVAGASDETRRRIREVAEQLGYVPDERARKLRQSSSRLIGVTFDLHQPFHGDLVEHLYPAAERHGYDLAISAVAPTRDENAAFQALVRERCEVAVLLGSTLPNDDLAARADRLPLLLVARHSSNEAISSIRSNDVEGIGLAVDHLVALGHRHLVHIDGGSAPGADDRRAGFTAAVERHDLGHRAHIVSGGPTERDGARAAGEALTAYPHSTAVVAFNDRCAAGVLDLLVRRQIDVPVDMSVIGYDDSRLAIGPHTEMSTISQNAAEMADSAIEGALALIAGAPASDVILTPHLVARATTSAARSPGPTPAEVQA